MRRTGIKKGRSCELKRRTELKQGDKPLQRKKRLEPGDKPLARRTELPAVNKARQARKTAAAGMSKMTAKDIVRERSGGQCEFRFPGVCRGRGTNFAHIKPEGQGGLYVPSNLVMSCGFGNNFPGCHAYQENNRAQAYENGWLRRRDDHSQPSIHMWIRVRDEWVEGDWLLDDAGGAVPATNSGEAA
jgi:hypothetical protein